MPVILLFQLCIENVGLHCIFWVVSFRISKISPNIPVNLSKKLKCGLILLLFLGKKCQNWLVFLDLFLDLFSGFRNSLSFGTKTKKEWNIWTKIFAKLLFPTEKRPGFRNSLQNALPCLVFIRILECVSKLTLKMLALDIIMICYIKH